MEIMIDWAENGVKLIAFNVIVSLGIYAGKTQMLLTALISIVSIMRLLLIAGLTLLMLSRFLSTRSA
ncbi:hypothetical protein BPOR_0024g00210 [Botrytis porri]|uniref:Uncharacterized protein n=1 Tax=Botrytis porri TaxID=87229 RepID=A0A4Z1L436_9HELO|nr:hypothetical protein BPOR_0024g00210 [Botrytis porri]